MEKIIVMAPGHELWDGTIAFAARCPWKVGTFLAEKMRANDFESNERVLAALHDDEVAAFCTFTNQDEMPKEYGFGPFIGFLFVAEKYRGNRLSEQMVNAACNVAKEQGFSAIYLMSGEVGLYEKYSFTKVGDYKTIYGSADQFFSKTL